MLSNVESLTESRAIEQSVLLYISPDRNAISFHSTDKINTGRIGAGFRISDFGFEPPFFFSQPPLEHPKFGIRLATKHVAMYSQCQLGQGSRRLNRWSKKPELAQMRLYSRFVVTVRSRWQSVNR